MTANRNKDILYRALNGEKMSRLAKEYLVSTSFIAYTVHRQVKKVMPDMYGKDIVRHSTSHTSNRPLMRQLIKIKPEIIKKINDMEIESMVYESKVTNAMIVNAKIALESCGYIVIEPSQKKEIEE